MAADFLRSVRFLARRLTRLDRIALLGVLLYVLVWLVRMSRPEFLGGGLTGFLVFLVGFLPLGYFAVRFLSWVRSRLLWSLRNRLIVAYVFIAVVPVLLLLAMAALSAYLIYWQLGAYLFYDDVQKRVERIAGAADALAASLASETGASERLPLVAISPKASALLTRAKEELPGLQVELNAGRELLEKYGERPGNRFAGIVQSGDKLWLRSVVARSTPAGRFFVSVSAPVTSDLMDTLAPELGPIQLTLYRLATPQDSQSRILPIGNRQFVRLGQVFTRHRKLPPPAHRIDYEIRCASRLEAVQLNAANDAMTPVVAFFSTRPSMLNRRLFSSLGEFSGPLLSVLTVIGIIFLVLEAGALVTGVALTRTITRAVADLYGGTLYVQAGDLSHRVRIERKDQLGALAESFNSMTSSISTLIEEQRQRQRLENELSIAREVQAQLFPQTLPSLPGVQLRAICRPARMVSGDYYDFIALGPTQIAMALADITGKGISAALLMASLQSALRSQVMLDGRASSEKTADLVTRLNRHLFLNTPEDRFATFFYAVYDGATRLLHYTNAGHLPPLCIAAGSVRRLEEGGMVLGVLDDCAYEQGVITVEPGSLLVAYSDGLIEPENVYGEEFGEKRLTELALRHANASPHAVADALMAAAEEWAGSPEQADDMTIIVARME